MKKRIIPVILIDEGGRVLTSKTFNPWRTVGVLPQMVRMHNLRGADELLILDIFASKENREIKNRIFSLVSSNCNIPVTMGGGIKKASIALNYINQGADKICLNFSTIENTIITKEIAEILGNQAVVASINYTWCREQPMCFDYLNKKTMSKRLQDEIENLIQLGAGELFLTCVDNDGSLAGLDSKILAHLDQIRPKIPIILAGGAASEKDVIEILKSNSIAGIAASSIFVFTHHTPSTLRNECKNSGIPMREI